MSVWEEGTEAEARCKVLGQEWASRVGGIEERSAAQQGWEGGGQQEVILEKTQGARPMAWGSVDP